MHQIITLDRVRILIGKDRESVSLILRETARVFRFIDADRNRPNAYFVELIQASFNTPQLGVTRRSPVASVENEQHTFGRVAVYGRGQKLIERYLLS